jgi:hypothetical protein
MRTTPSLVILAASLCGCAGDTTSASAPPAHLDDIQGQYDLADGRVLTIAGSGRRMHAQLDGRPDTLLAPAGGAVFDATDGAFRLSFDQYENGNVTGVTLEETGPARPADAR